MAQFANQRGLAQQRYAQVVAEGTKADSPLVNLKGQVFLSNEMFVQNMQAHLHPDREDIQIPFKARHPPPLPLAEIESRPQNRNPAIVAAYATGGYSYQQIADHIGVHFTTVGRIVRTSE